MVVAPQQRLIILQGLQSEVFSQLHDIGRGGERERIIHLAKYFTS